jgi:serine/threonine-protein kinase HipA
VAGLTLFKQLVFSWLIGNGDAHAKNYSILETPSGEWRISPAYDLLCTRYYQDREMALPINEQVTGWSRQLLVEAASKIQVPEKAAQKVITKQLLVLDNLSKTIIDGALPFESHANYEVAKFLKKRAERLA